jgi:hypothetical protein
MVCRYLKRASLTARITGRCSQPYRPECTSQSKHRNATLRFLAAASSSGRETGVVVEAPFRFSGSSPAKPTTSIIASMKTPSASTSVARLGLWGGGLSHSRIGTEVSPAGLLGSLPAKECCRDRNPGAGLPRRPNHRPTSGFSRDAAEEKIYMRRWYKCKFFSGRRTFPSNLPYPL